MIIPRHSVLLVVGMALVSLVLGPVSAQDPLPIDPLHRPFDELLDVYVRDGLVYYQALRADRGKLDRYTASLDTPNVVAAYMRWSQDQRAAFWLNAYNALVLRTVIDHYPIRGRASQYPAVSIRQIPGAFERLPYRAAGRSVTLDAIEKTILPEFRDPRLYLALGRGAIGSPRLRSEAFSGDRLETQLKNIVKECPTRSECILLDPTTNVLSVTSVVGWHEAEFVAAYATSTDAFPLRSPVERAVLAFIQPNLLATEREFLTKDMFQVAYSEFDWQLNDLTARTR
jgi:Protein of unknown function, DUF547